MAWIARGIDESGRMLPTPDVHTSTVPALATHHGELWCIWGDPNGDLYYAIGDNNTFQPRLQFPDQGIPVLAELTGVLHAIIIKESGAMVHWTYDDLNEQWGMLSVLNQDQGFVAATTPALVAFHNKLALVFILNESLFYSIWTINRQDGTSSWKYPQEVSGIKKVGGIPALFVLEQKLHVICESSDESREILGFSYDIVGDVWNSCGDVSEGKAASGVSATSYGDSAFLTFMEDGPGDQSHIIYISEFKNGAWLPQEPVLNQTSFDPPQLAILNGRLNCIFNANDDTKELKWYSRSLLDYSLSSWMGEVADEKLMSDITVPGTHDSCARSNVPFVRTQYLSVGKQMEAGLRFLDLRCRVHGDGVLYMYHGGIPINLPRYLKLETVMKEVFDFFEKNSSRPTEAVLVSINNDDVSGKVAPEVFYNAVKAHIDATPLYADGSSHWITSHTTCTLGEARGKAVLLRRYHPHPALSPSELLGLDLSTWPNNPPDTTLQPPSGLSITIQDHWQYLEPLPLSSLILSKSTFVTNMLSKAASSPPEHWFLNFMSAVGVPSMEGEVAESHWIAVGAHSKVVGKWVEGMNVVVRRGFDWGVGVRYGVVAMDYPELPKDSDLIAVLVGTNI